MNVAVDGGKGNGAADGAGGPAAGNEESTGEGFSLEIPGIGVDVKSGKDGTTWDTPLSKGSVKDGKVDVDAPGTQVDVDLNTGETRVQTPGASADAE
ncbi:MAG: hypothetical protein AAF790_00290 [Planctomycetota bacterium]